MADDNTTQPDSEGTEATPGDVPLQIPELSGMDMLSAKVVELENSVNQYKDQLLRKAAEFENFKKRTEIDYASIIKYSNEDLIAKLLPVIDDFERSLKASKLQSGENTAEGVFMKGMELIFSKFTKLLETQGVRHFEVVGKPFDPQLHDALMQLPRSDVPPHTVIEEVEKGYMLNEKVIRHARVVVSAEAGTSDPHDEQAPEP